MHPPEICPKGSNALHQTQNTVVQKLEPIFGKHAAAKNPLPKGVIFTLDA
jgi:hypothetical protein